MIEALRREWYDEMSVQELIALRDHLDEMLQSIRSKKNILSPVMWCPHCKTRHQAAPPKVSVRATVLALGRFEITEADLVKEVEKRWKRFRKERNLDLYGKAIGGRSEPHGA